MSKKRINPSEAAAALGRLGGIARAASLTPDQQSEIAKKAASQRWAAPRDLKCVCGECPTCYQREYQRKRRQAKKAE